MPAKKSNTKEPAAPVMGMVEYPTDPTNGRFYVLLPAPPDRLVPAIRVVSGRIFPCYIRLTLERDDGMIFSVGGEMQIKYHFELRGIREALRLMDTVWKGVLDDHRPLDAEKVERLAQDLTSRPESSRALIRLSGVIGKEGAPKNAGDYARNVVALCYWKGALGFYKGRQKNEDFAPVPAGRAWSYSAKMMNQICERILPRSQGWEWNDFTENGLRSFYDRRNLDAKR